MARVVDAAPAAGPPGLSCGRIEGAARLGDAVEADPAVAVIGDAVRIKHFTSRLQRPDGLDVRVQTGEVLVVTGPSGCGKSSLALALDGLIPHHVEADLDGRLTVFGTEVSGAHGAALPRIVGMVLQDPDAQLVTTNVLDEVCFCLENLELPAPQIEPRARAALAKVGLEGQKEKSPARMSGGQRQRLALACAIAARPRLLVLDEPTSHIDPSGAAAFFALLPDLQADGMTIVIAEHDLDLVLPYADRLLVLDRTGRRLAEGPPAEVLSTASAAMVAAGVRLPIAFRAGAALADAGATNLGRAVTIARARDDLCGADTSRCRVSDPAPRRSTGADLVRAEKLQVVRGRRAVLSDFSLRVRHGEFLALLGPNGAGKTTAGLALAGLLRSRGDLSIDGADPRRLTMRQLSDRVGYVFQNPEHQFVTNTTADEIAHGMRRRRLPRAVIEARVTELLDQLDLGAVREQHPFALSGGQKRRLSVATVLATAPKLLILDEPSYGLDEGAAAALMGILWGLNRTGTTIIMIVHDLTLAADYAERIVILRDGVVKVDGETGDVVTDDAALIRHGLAPLPLRQCFAGLRERDLRFQDVYRLDQIEAAR